MIRRIVLTLSVVGLTLLPGGCAADTAKYSVEDVSGPNPRLAEPERSLVPTINIAPATGWTPGEKPVAARGFQVTAFATGLAHPRWLYVLPNGDVLVAETNAPAKPEDGKGIRGWVMGKVMQTAGAKTSSADRITLLRDADGDGNPEIRTVFIQDLHSPFGMALIGDKFYVANTDAVVRFPYRKGQTSITAAGEKIVDLPAGSINHHWTKSLLAGPKGKYLYVGVGSNSNVGENGIAAEANRAAILQIDIAAGSSRVYAQGLRNPVGMDWQPQTGDLWVAVNERDELGSDLVPDYMTHVQEGGFYGWPYSYYGQHVDTRVQPQRTDLVAKAIKPDYALGPHTASLGLVFYDAALFPPRYRNGAFIGQHGSWNRNPPSGYKVVFVPFEDGIPKGLPEDILAGFLDINGNARGRPVGVAIDKKGALLVADDVGNTIWRVTPEAK